VKVEQCCFNVDVVVEMRNFFINRWEGGKPVGIESSIEAHDGTRKSIIVPDPRLPEGWSKHLAQRTHGASAGKWDTIIVRFVYFCSICF
jgi:hypothetical protein